MTKARLGRGIITKLRVGQPLSLRNRLRLRLWQKRQHRRYLASLNDRGPHAISGALVWTIRAAMAYAIAGLIIWLVTPLVGLGYALLLAMLAWIVMGAYWLS